MSKSRKNTIELGATEDETARLIKKAKTDEDKHITYDPVHRPEVANLINLVCLASGETPESVAGMIGDGGGDKLKQVLSEAINEYLRALRARRGELETSMEYIREVLNKGVEQARQVGTQTLLEVRQAMNMEY